MDANDDSLPSSLPNCANVAKDFLGEGVSTLGESLADGNNRPLLGVGGEVDANDSLSLSSSPNCANAAKDFLVGGVSTLGQSLANGNNRPLSIKSGEEPNDSTEDNNCWDEVKETQARFAAGKYTSPDLFMSRTTLTCDGEEAMSENRLLP